jgi:hypothetical protein
MEHAYGPAEEVPDLLRGLVSGDPAVRELALDGMYGAVHHQGDVYECTIVSIPFLLEAVAHPELPGRGAIVELLASIGGADVDGVDDQADGVLDRADSGTRRRRRRPGSRPAHSWVRFGSCARRPDGAPRPRPSCPAT